MKLSEIKLKKLSPTSDFSIVKLKTDSLYEFLHNYDVNVEVHFMHEPASKEDHPYGDTTASENHDADVEIREVHLLKDVVLYNEDGEETGKTLEAGTDLVKENWWKAFEKSKEYKELEEQVLEKIRD